MDALLSSLIQLLTSLGDLLIALAVILRPLLPLGAWIAFWLFAVDWVKLRSVLLRGGWIGLVLIGLVAVLVWGTIAPPDARSHSFLGLTLSNFVGKTVLVTTLMCIMFLCGSVQLSGCCSTLCRFDEPATDVEHHGEQSGSQGHGDTRGHHTPAHH